MFASPATLVRKPKAKARRTLITTIIIQSKKFGGLISLFEKDYVHIIFFLIVLVHIDLAMHTIRRIYKRFSSSNVQRIRKSKASRQVFCLFVFWFWLWLFFRFESW